MDKWHRVRLLGLILALVSLTTSCVNVYQGAPEGDVALSSSSPSSEASRTYTSSEYGFSVDYCKDWRVKEDYPGLAVVFAGPAVGEWNYYVNISIEIMPVAKGMTLADYVELYEEDVKEDISNYTKVGEYSTTISGVPSAVLVITAPTSTDNGDEVPLKDKVAIVLKDEVAYMITYDVPAAFHDEYAHCFDLAISSFHLFGYEAEASPATVSLSEATMTTAVDSDLRPLDTTDVFAPDTPDIHCSAKLSNAPSDTEVKAEWIYI